mgnify:CR=1 FL=1
MYRCFSSIELTVTYFSFDQLEAPIDAPRSIKYGGNVRFKNKFLNYFLQDEFYPDVSYLAPLIGQTKNNYLKI